MGRNDKVRPRRGEARILTHKREAAKAVAPHTNNNPVGNS